MLLMQPPDATATEAGVGACKTSGVELCEDFESGAIDPKIWTQHASGGAALVPPNDDGNNHGLYAEHGAHQASRQQHGAHLDVDVPAAPLRQRPRHRRGDDLRGTGHRRTLEVGDSLDLGQLS